MERNGVPVLQRTGKKVCRVEKNHRGSGGFYLFSTIYGSGLFYEYVKVKEGSSKWARQHYPYGVKA